MQKHTGHEFWVKRGGLGASDSKKSTACFFAPEVARAALGVGFLTSFVDRNGNYRNTPDMRFGSNSVDWVRPIRSNQLKVFLLRSSSGQNGPRGQDSHEFCPLKPKLRKHTRHEF